MHRIPAALIVSIAFSGCAYQFVPLSELTAAESKWKAQSIQNYGFVLEVKSLLQDPRCSESGKIEVEVRAGQTAKFGSCTPDVDLAQRFGTVDSIFETIREERYKRPPHFEVRYNPAMGYPEYIYINHSQTTADYSVQYSVRDLRATER